MSMEENLNQDLVKELLERYFILGPNGNETQEFTSTFYMKHGYVKSLKLNFSLLTNFQGSRNEI